MESCIAIGEKFDTFNVGKKGVKTVERSKGSSAALVQQIWHINDFYYLWRFRSKDARKISGISFF